MNKNHKNELKGTENAGYRIVAVKEAPIRYPIPLVPTESIVLAKKISDKAPTEYVIWEYVGNGEFRNGIYENDKKEAQKVFDSLTS